LTSAPTRAMLLPEKEEQWLRSRTERKSYAQLARKRWLLGCARTAGNGSAGQTRRALRSRGVIPARNASTAANLRATRRKLLDLRGLPAPPFRTRGRAFLRPHYPYPIPTWPTRANRARKFWGISKAAPSSMRSGTQRRKMKRACSLPFLPAPST
jgi:hypothetical protein